MSPDALMNNSACTIHIQHVARAEHVTIVIKMALLEPIAVAEGLGHSDFERE
jgi:hypothetical protein